MRVGTSFSARRCSLFGLPAQPAFRDLLELRFALVRISAYWDQIREHGYAELDWMLDQARAAGQPIVLTVGMKGIQWPEFYLPPDLQPSPRRNGQIGSDSPIATEVVGFVSETVARYGDRREIAAWQVENEPFNRSGPQGWWIDPSLVRREIQAVRAVDARPIVLNAFARFESRLDSDSRPRHGRFGIRRLTPEKAILGLLGAGDVLGLDVYTAIGAQHRGMKVVRKAAGDWAGAAGRWLRLAKGKGREAWIIEAQAEPWEPTHETFANPLSFAPEDIRAVYEKLVRAGYSTILLWGCEYWLWRAAQGDARWLEAARGILREA